MTKKSFIAIQDLAAKFKNSTNFNGFNSFSMQAKNQYLDRTLRRSMLDIYFFKFLFFKLYFQNSYTGYMMPRIIILSIISWLIINSFFVVVEITADGSVVKDPVKKLSVELVNLRSLLTAGSGIGLNGVILTGHKEGKTCVM